MELKDLTIEVVKSNECDSRIRQEIISVIKDNHYSGKVGRYPSFWAYLKHKDKIVGAMQLGTPCSKNSGEFYAPNGSLIELKRLAIIDNTPKNTESYFIGKVMKYLVKSTDYTHVLSYADQNEGHTGIIYKASNFKLLGKTRQSSNCVVIHNGEVVPTRTAYNKKLPLYKEIMEGRKKGTTYNKYLKPKNIYLYDLESRR